MFSYIFFFFLNSWWVNSSASPPKEKKKSFQNQMFTIILRIAIAIIELKQL